MTDDVIKIEKEVEMIEKLTKEKEVDEEYQKTRFLV